MGLNNSFCSSSIFLRTTKLGLEIYIPSQTNVSQLKVATDLNNLLKFPESLQHFCVRCFLYIFSTTFL